MDAPRTPEDGVDVENSKPIDIDSEKHFLKVTYPSFPELVNSATFSPLKGSPELRQKRLSLSPGSAIRTEPCKAKTLTPDEENWGRGIKSLADEGGIHFPSVWSGEKLSGTFMGLVENFKSKPHLHSEFEKN